MALVGFPDQIEVILGSAWYPNVHGLNEDDVVVLTKVAGQNKWSEDGTETPNYTTNRLIIEFSNSLGKEVHLKGARNSGGSPTFMTVFYRLMYDSYDYTFLDLWNRSPVVESTPDYYFIYSVGSVTYNDEVFKSMEAVIPSSQFEASSTTSVQIVPSIAFSARLDSNPNSSASFSANSLAIANLDSDGFSLAEMHAKRVAVRNFSNSTAASGALDSLVGRNMGMNLFLDGGEIASVSGWLDLSIHGIQSGASGLFSNAYFYTSGEPFCSSLNLYTFGNGSLSTPASGNMNLWIQGLTLTSSNSLDLYLYNTVGFASTGLALVIEGLGTTPGTIPTSGYMNMYLGVTDGVEAYFNSVIIGQDASSSGLNFYTFGVEELLSGSMSLFSIGLASGSRSISLFTRGY